MPAVDAGFRRQCGYWTPDLLLRDVPQHMITALERQAALPGRDVDAEHRAVLEAALRAGFWERAAALREETRGRVFTPSEVLIRQDRDCIKSGT
jgi:antitoxin FitA